MENTMNASLTRFLSAAALFAVWLALVILKMAPAAPLVVALSSAITGLGTFHAVISQKEKPNA